MLAYVLIEKFAADSGYSPGAIRKKIERGEWREGEVWVKRGGRIHIIIEGYNRWVEQALAAASAPPPTRRSRSTSGTAVSAAANA